MAEAKLIVIYPRPKDVEAFEKIYTEEHVPLAVAKLTGKTKMVATKITSSPQGIPPFYLVAEVYFPSKAALDACAASPGGKEALAPDSSTGIGRLRQGRPSSVHSHGDEPCGLPGCWV